VTLPATILTGTFCDRYLSASAFVAAIVRFEATLAKVGGSLGFIPGEAAQAVEHASQDLAVDLDRIAVEGHRAGTPVVEILRQLRAAVERRRPGAGEFVHFGSTSQDALDTATMMCLKPCVQRAAACLDDARKAAVRLARQHASTPMLARTLMQPAGITTFGFKAAQWAAALARSEKRVIVAAGSALAVQLAGPLGSGLAFGERWLELQRELARELQLSAGPDLSWQSMRDAAANLFLQLGLATSVADKIATDVALLTQGEVGEAHEPSADDGVSSAMPHKRNPVICMRIRACAHVVRGLTATVLETTTGEHERGLGSWQAELAAAPLLVSYSVGALESLLALLEGLRFDAGRAENNVAKAIDAIAGGAARPPTFDRERAVKAAASAAEKILAEGGTDR
jgi:3-carboxy-cis,cis-muconate cycloisomerase